MAVFGLGIAAAHPIIKVALVGGPQTGVVETCVAQAFAEVFEKVVEFAELFGQGWFLDAGGGEEEHLVAAVGELADFVTDDDAGTLNFRFAVGIRQNGRATLAHDDGLAGTLLADGHAVGFQDFQTIIEIQFARFFAAEEHDFSVP